MAEKEYIERAPFIEDLTAMKKEYDAISIDGMIKAIANAPAADVAEVVRCKDCKWWWDNTGITKRPKGFCYEHGMCTNGDAFCSSGERKEATP